LGRAAARAMAPHVPTAALGGHRCVAVWTVALIPHDLKSARFPVLPHFYTRSPREQVTPRTACCGHAAPARSGARPFSSSAGSDHDAPIGSVALIASKAAAVETLSDGDTSVESKSRSRDQVQYKYRLVRQVTSPKGLSMRPSITSGAWDPKPPAASGGMLLVNRRMTAFGVRARRTVHPPAEPSRE
jgi:hypothetical protein